MNTYVKKMIKPITDVEQDRLVEINFYLFVHHLLDTYNKSVLATDVIEALAQLYNCNITFLKKLTHDIYANNSEIIPSKQELVIMLYKSGMPVRRIRDVTGIHPQTVYRYLEEYITNGQFEYQYRLEDEYLIILKSFMTQLEELLSWR